MLHRLQTFLKSLYLARRLYFVVGGVVVLFVVGHFWPAGAVFARGALVVLVALAVLDVLVLYGSTRSVEAERGVPKRLSNGDENEIRIALTNGYGFSIRVTVIDELPVQLQVREAVWRRSLAAGASCTIRYTVRPVRRGEYRFGALNVYASSLLGLMEHRFRFDEGHVVPVYPSYQRMKAYELLAASNRLEEAGIKRQRRVGHTMEFDHVRAYVTGDDVRTINWKATARSGDLRVNQHRDARNLPVYSLIDTGRVMKMPFDGMTLLDYSINASLVLSSIALQKQDRAGLVTFSHEVGAVLPAERRNRQIYKIQETLYKVETDFLETDYTRLAAMLRRRLRQRGLLLLFTNFETRAGLMRQLPSLKVLARQHTVVVVFFENTALRSLQHSQPEHTDEIYVKTIAEAFAFEKREIVRILRRHGIHAVLTPPRELTVRTINKYLALKAKGIV